MLQTGKCCISRIFMLLKQDPSCEGEAITMNAITLDANNHITFFNVLSYNNFIQCNRANSHPRQIKTKTFLVAFDDIAELSHLTARNRNVGKLRTCSQALRQAVDHVGIRVLQRKVVNHRNRRRAHTQEIIHIHGHTVDPDGVIFPDHLGNENFRADTISRDSQANATTQVNDIRKVAYRKSDSSYTTMGWPCWPNAANQPFEGGFFSIGINTSF